MKTTKIISIILIMVMIFAGCSKNAATNEDETQTLDFNLEEKTALDVNKLYDSVNQGEGDPNTPMEKVLADFAIPTQGFAVFTSYDDPDSFEINEYNGGEIEFFYKIGVGMEGESFDIGVVIDGILQDCKIERDGVVSDYKKLHYITLDKYTTATYKVSVKPNTGKAGDTVMLQAFSHMNPYIIIESDTEYYEYGKMMFGTTGFTNVKMNVDAAYLTDDVCKNYSKVKVNTYNPLVGELFSYKSEEKNVIASMVYTDFNSAVFRDESGCANQDYFIKADNSSECPIYITLGGIDFDTTQRVCIYVNGKPMPVFDGKYYADIPVKAGKQTDIEITLDTTSLDEWNNICVTHFNLYEIGLMGKDLACSDYYSLRVLK